MKSIALKFAAIAAITVIGAGATASQAQASFIFDASVGGAASGVNYANFNNLPLVRRAAPAMASR